MSKSLKIILFVSFSLVIIYTAVISGTSMVVAQEEPPVGIQEKLAEISDEEKNILQNLFTMVQELEVMESEEKNLTQEIDVIKQDIKDFELAIASEEINYSKKQEGLKMVLKSYQRMGPGSYIEIILNSDSLSTLLRRINTLRDLTRNTGVLLEQLEISKEKLSIDKSKLAEKLVLLEERQKQSREALSAKVKLKEEKEAYLASLKEEKNYYQNYIANLQQKLDELKPLLSQTAKEFSSIIADGNISEDTLKITVSLFSIKGTIEEKAFNDIISKRASLSELKFAFHTDKAVISIPEKRLELSGVFVIKEDNILSFQPEEGSFYGMPLELRYIEELLNNSGLALNLKPLLDKNILKSIKLQEGYIELFVKPNLF